MEKINNKIKELQLPLKMDRPTPGQGNCFFQAVMQQLERAEINIQNVYVDHKNLRKCICDYATMCETVELVNYKVNYDELALSISAKNWDCFFHEMKKPRVWAEGPVAQVTAWLLQRDILVISEGSKESNPYLLIPGDKTHSYPPMVLGNAAGCHYQSYIPLEEIKVANVVKKRKPNCSLNKNEMVFCSEVKPFPSIINMIISMKEKHQQIVNDLDSLTNEFRKLHYLLRDMPQNDKNEESDKEILDVDVDDEFDDEILNSFNEEMDINEDGDFV